MCWGGGGDSKVVLWDYTIIFYHKVKWYNVPYIKTCKKLSSFNLILVNRTMVLEDLREVGFGVTNLICYMSPPLPPSQNTTPIKKTPKHMKL